MNFFDKGLSVQSRDGTVWIFARRLSTTKFWCLHFEISPAQQNVLPHFYSMMSLCSSIIMKLFHRVPSIFPTDDET